MTLPQIGDGGGQAFDAVLHKLDVFGLGPQADADALHRLTLRTRRRRDMKGLRQ